MSYSKNPPLPTSLREITQIAVPVSLEFVLILVLTLRPSGLMGERVADRS